MSDCSRRVVIWGASGHAMVVADVLRLQAQYELMGFVDELNPGRKGEEFAGARILGGREELGRLIEQGLRHVILAFGHCAGRLRTAEVVRAMGLELISAVHPSAVVAGGSRIGQGTVVCAGAVIAPGCEIGEVAIINTCASVDHECVLGDGVHVCPGTHLAGVVRVGRSSWLGIGSTVSNGITIGDRVMVGAGSVVVRDIPSDTLAYGVPARPVRQIQGDF
jgi:UDP-N-acetylbacillosamine N-acetyltransferase